MDKVVLFDIDDTLVKNGEYPERFYSIKDKIEKIKENNNITFGVCTHRPFNVETKKIIDDYSINGLILTEGGACMYRNYNYDYNIEYFKDHDKFDKDYLKHTLENYLINNNIDKSILDINNIVISKNRIMSSTVKLPFIKDNIDNNTDKLIDSLVEYLKSDPNYLNMRVFRSYDNNCKIILAYNDIDKISAIQNFCKDKEVILISDFENYIPEHDNSIKIYSVGENEVFNRKCDKVYMPYDKGVEKILDEMEEKQMKDYEQISENCKMYWEENFNLTTEKYTQVSGYVFNDDNELLIVKNGNLWTVPGGHPEAGEDRIETLKREVMEEAYVTLKDIKYLGSVEVVENGETYYQTRYTAKVDEILDFKGEYEISERKFVKLEELANYIKWANGKTFSAQIQSARKVWNI